MKTKRLSVVIATYNRGKLLCDLLGDLAKQTVSPKDFEVIVIDDGSKESPIALIEAMEVPYQLMVDVQANAGAAAARHRGVELARGEIVVITDDDMRLPVDFLAQHLAAHDAGSTVVLGNIRPAPGLSAMPIFERFHAHQLERFVKGVREKTIPVRGVHVCTGNVSFRRADYLAIGGFDRTLGRSEDRELGIRLEKSGAKFSFAEGAHSVHGSDHADLQVWMRRAFNYGVYDRRIAKKHAELEIADPWRFFFLVSPMSRPLMLATVFAPSLGKKLSRAAMQTAITADSLSFDKLAVFGTTLSYGLEYFRGMREDAGSLRASLGELGGYLKKRGKADKTPKAPADVTAAVTADATDAPTQSGPVRRFQAAVRGDYGSLQRYRAKYHNEKVPLTRLPVDLVKKVGFQTMTMVRVMQLLRDLQVPVAPQVVSRLIRHMYGAEVHWNAEIAPGVSVVHGVGLVISHAAKIGEGCILFQNVTLGEGIDPTTRAVGAPTLGRDVHIGPGATLLGPIEVGEGTKIMAGAVLTHSVPPGSLVKPADAVVCARAGGKKDGARGKKNARPSDAIEPKETGSQPV